MEEKRGGRLRARIWGGGSKSLSPLARASGKLCKFSSGVQEGTPGAEKFYITFGTYDDGLF